MSCNGCSNKNCRGCKDIKVVLPEQFGLDPDTPVVDNGDGTITINFNDGTSFTYSTAGTVPEDDWVHIDENSSVVANIDFATAGPDPNVRNSRLATSPVKATKLPSPSSKIRTKLHSIGSTGRSASGP